MLILIVILFALCWTPIQFFGLIVWFYPISLDTDLKYNLYVGLYFASHWLSMSHSFINPLIYSYMSSNFRVRHELNRQKTISFIISKLFQMKTNIYKYYQKDFIYFCLKSRYFCNIYINY